MKKYLEYFITLEFCGIWFFSDRDRRTTVVLTGIYESKFRFLCKYNEYRVNLWMY